MREFTTAVKAKAAEDEAPDEKPTIKFTLDGVDCWAFEPTESQTAVLISATSGRRRSNDDTATLINFIFNLFDAETKMHLQDRLLDRNDPFELSSDDPEEASLMTIVEDILEEASGNPTKPSSASTSSRASTGQKSTAARQRKGTTR